MQKQHLAGFLQDELVKKVNKEADQEWALKATQPLPKFSLPKRDKSKGVLGWLIFFKTQFRP